MSIGTTLSFSISGWRAFFKFMYPLLLSFGAKADKSIANFALNGEKPTDLKGIEKAIFYWSKNWVCGWLFWIHVRRGLLFM